MNRLAVALAVIAVIAVIAAATPALADPHAEAVALFDQGIKDMKAGRLDKACPELQASLDLVKDSGTKGALARCHGLAGRVASAWLLWRELADTAPTRELRTDAAAQATRLEPRLPRYTIKLASAAPKLTVQINGRSVATTVPVAVPIDPGKVSVTASAEGTEPWTHDYTAVEGQTLAIEIPALEPRAVATPAKPRKPDPARSPATDLADRRHTRHVIAFVIGAVALGAAGGGTALGLDARAKYEDAKRRCGGVIDQCPPTQIPDSQKRVDDARRSALWSTVAFGAAGALALTATIVWFTAPSSESRGETRADGRAEARAVTLAPTATTDSIGLILHGTF